MIQNLVFCEECRNNVAYTVTEAPMIGTINKTVYHYCGKEAHCADCDALLYAPEINDANLKALYDVYRRENGMIPLEAILAIPKKYGIDRRSLSLLLGWDEQTFSRYCDGDIPSKEHSDILIKLYNDPTYYAEMLKTGR